MKVRIIKLSCSSICYVLFIKLKKRYNETYTLAGCLEKMKKKSRTQPQFKINGIFYFCCIWGVPRPISTCQGRMTIVFGFYLYISYSWKETKSYVATNQTKIIFQSSRYIRESWMYMNKLEMVIYLPKIQVMSSSLYHYDSDRRVRCLCYL